MSQMSRLLDLPPEVILHIMKFARWSRNDPDYTSMKSWALTCRSFGACAQAVLFSHAILRNVHAVRSFSHVISEISEMGRYFRQRVYALEVFTKDELGVSSIHLHDFVKLLPWLPNLKCLGLDLDRFYTFASISLASLRHASDTLTSITLKPSCGWTQFQLLERTPSLQKVHYISHSPFDHPTQLSHYSTPCPIAFKEVTHTSMNSPFGCRSLFWLLTYPEVLQSHSSAIKPPEINLLSLLGTAPEDSILGSILSFAGSRIRRLHVEQFSPTAHLLAYCTSLNELVVGIGDEWISPLGLSASMHLAAYPGSTPALDPPFFIHKHDLLDLPLSHSQARRPRNPPCTMPKTVMSSIPSSVKRLIIFGKKSKLYPLDDKFKDTLELLQAADAMTALRELHFVVDDAPADVTNNNASDASSSANDEDLGAFSHPAIEREWNVVCQRLGVEFRISYNKGCTSPRFHEAEEHGSTSSMLRPTLMTTLFPE